jgi:hypothetical protein
VLRFSNTNVCHINTQWTGAHNRLHISCASSQHFINHCIEIGTQFYTRVGFHLQCPDSLPASICCCRIADILKRENVLRQGWPSSANDKFHKTDTGNGRPVTGRGGPLCFWDVEATTFSIQMAVRSGLRAGRPLLPGRFLALSSGTQRKGNIPRWKPLSSSG